MNSDFCVAVHGLVYLNHHGEDVISSEELAKNICTNAVRVRKVMSKMKRAGLVETKEGVEGGYHSTGMTASATLALVAEAMDVCFVSMGWRSGNHDMDCLIACGMSEIMDDIFADLNDTCMKKLAEIKISDIDKKIFSKERG